MALTKLHNNDVVIVSAARTPIGGFQGALSALSATELGAASIQAVLKPQKNV